VVSSSIGPFILAIEKMNRKILTFILTSIWLLFWASPSIALVTEFQKAVDAYKREDYKTSYKLMLPLAKKGLAQAQYNLGVMYGNGKGIAKDYSKAIKWWNLAANQGNGKAQHSLGLIHEKGKGVKKNLKKAKKWFQLASNQGLAKAQEKLNLLLIEEYYFEKINETKEHLQENTASSKELKSLKEKNSKEINDLQTTTASLRSELNQIKAEKTEAIEAINQANAKAKQELLANLKKLKSLKEKNFKEINDLQTTTASLSSELNQIKFEKTMAIEATNQANAKAKQELLASSTEFKSLKEKSSKEIKDLQTTTASLRSELNQIKSEKAKAIEATNQANAKANQEQLASINDNPSELNTESFSFRGDAFDVARYSADTFTEIGDYIDDKFDSFGFECSQPKNKDQQSECFEQFSETIAKDKIKKDSIFKKNSTSNLTKKSQTGKSRNNSEVITSKDLVSKHLDKWVRAWEKQDIELYLSFYSKEFKGSKERHADWRISRQAALKRHTNISIQLQNIQISQSKDTVEINFTQTFKSDGYSDIGIKELVWAKNGSDWRIIKETWIPHKKTT